MAAVARSARPASVAPLVLPALAIAFGAASAAVALEPVVPTTYGATSAAAAAAGLAAGLGLIGAGLLVRRGRRAGSIGPVAALLGCVWLAPVWVGWEGGPAWVRSAAMVAAPFLIALLVHLVVAFPSGRVQPGPARAVVAIVYAAASLYSVGRALLRDPFLTLDCWSNCSENVFVVRHAPDAVRLLDGFWLRFSAITCALLAAFAAWRLLRATRAGRTVVWPALVPAAFAAAGEVAYALALLGEPEDPQRAGFRAIFFARAIALCALAVGLAWTVVRAWRTRTAVSRLAADLGEAPRPGSLRTSLARSLGDERLEVAYPLPGSKTYVDAEGRPVEPPGAGSRAATPIRRNGATVAVVVHDPSLTDASELEREIGATARLAVDNERLRAEVLAQLHDLRASRARIVEAADSARRRIERDLHDGAQQRLLTVLYELRLAGDARVAPALSEVQAALAQLREVAHGIYPAVLTEAGLGPALQTLGDEAPVAVLAAVPDERFPEAVERVAYVAVASAIDAAAGDVEVAVRREGDALVVSVVGVGPAPLEHVADRVGALGGSVEAADGTLRAVIPCA